MTQTFTISEEGTYALRTASGGAIVVAAMRGDTDISLPAGKIKLLPQWTAITGVTEASSVQVSSDIVVAFEVPAAGSTEQISVLGAEDVVVAGTATPVS